MAGLFLTKCWAAFCLDFPAALVGNNEDCMVVTLMCEGANDDRASTQFLL